jgi:hypothetical protein
MYELIFTLKMIVLIYGADNIIRYLKQNTNELARWYWLHAFSNLIVCYYTFKPLRLLLYDPIYYIKSDIQVNESAILVAIVHLYHLLFFKCSISDIYHHLIFVTIGTYMHSINMLGFITPMYHFFGCGLPGMIDYIALALVKDNIIQKNDRLKIALEINMWFRSPGIIMTWVFFYIRFIYLDYSFRNLVYFGIITLCSIVNAQYYNRQVALYVGKVLT